MITASYLVDYVKKAAADKWGYVGGGQGELYSLELANLWAKTRGHSKYYYVTQCKGWFGHYVADCSGLIIAANRSKEPGYMDQTADYLFNHCLTRGKIANLPEMPGLCVHKSGHIGVYIGNGLVAESRGYKYGVVITKVTDRPWTGWGKLANVDYSITITEETDVLKKGDNGELVGKWQENLIKTGYALPKYGVDRDFGGETETATNEFKADMGLTQDGTVDGAAWAAMADLRAHIAGDETDSLQSDLDELKASNERLKGYVSDFIKLVAQAK